MKSARSLFEREVLPPYLAKRRWFAAKNEALEQVRVAYLARLPGGERRDPAVRNRDPNRVRHGALAAAARGRCGKVSRRRRCRANSRSRGCVATAGSGF